MSKNHRGSGIRSLPKHGRGTCAICGKTDIKVLFEKEINGQNVNICKFCNAKLKNEARVEARKAKPVAEEAPAEEAAAEPAPAEETPAAEAPAEEAPAPEAEAPAAE